MNSWFVIRAQTATEPTEVSIYGDIGAWGVNAASLIDQVKSVQGPIRVRINSGGGDVFEGLALYNYLAGRGNVETIVDGLAASAASLPFLAGNKRTMPKSAYLMIHNPWSGAVGDADEMRKMADTLDRIGAGLASIYSRVTGIAIDAVQALMDAETWMHGETAKEGGWATDVVDLGPVKASIRPGRYANAPAVVIGATWTAPEAARNAFRKGIQQSEDGLGGDGLEATTIKEARSLASGERPTEFKVRKANSWWARNERFLESDANTPADVAANLWGGAAGRDWFRGLFNELESETKAAAQNELLVGDYVRLTYDHGETKGEIIEILRSGAASGADGAVNATEEDPAALIEVLREIGSTGNFEETDVQVARLFSSLTKTDAPTIVEIESPEDKSSDQPQNHMSKTAKLLALLGVQPAAEDTFLASAIADLGVTPEAVTEARKTGSTDFLATHIKDRIDSADAAAKAATDRANAILAACGAKADAANIAAEVASAIETKASARAVEMLAQRGIPAGKLAKAAGKPSTDSVDRAEIVAKFNAMKPGAERSAFFAANKQHLL
jgi:ATP-dependent protease ClpP protease subunit